MAKLCHEGVVSLLSFLAGAGLLIPFIISDLIVLFELGHGIISMELPFRLVYLFIYFVGMSFLLQMTLDGLPYRISWRGALLGHVFSLGITVIICAPDNWKSFGIYTSFLAMFHYGEFLAIAYNNPKTLSVESYILNHSRSYHIAAVSSWIEFTIEAIYFPKMKCCWIIWAVGIVLCLGGEILRKVAMWQASHNFTHVVRFEQVDNHRLVKHGLYAIVRHPSYVGWFYWSVGTQVILANPICLIGYSVVSWIFFKERIYMEEITLLNFFGEEYYKYQQSVPTGLPFIHGYKLQL